MSIYQYTNTRSFFLLYQILILLFLFSISDYALSESDSAYKLYKAAENGDIETVEQLIAKGVSVNAKNKSGSYALNAAAFKNGHKMIKLLLDNGANVNSQNRGLDIPLICATKNSIGNEKTVKILIEAGSNLDAVDKDGKTALFYALKKDQTAAASILSKAE